MFLEILKISEIGTLIGTSLVSGTVNISILQQKNYITSFYHENFFRFKNIDLIRIVIVINMRKSLEKVIESQDIAFVNEE